jgi:hypothetical protein
MLSLPAAEVPPLAAAIHSVQAAEMAALIQLGMNSSSTATAAAAVSILPGVLPHLPADAVLELLLTAVARQSVNHAVQHLISAHPGIGAFQQLTQEHVLAVLQRVTAVSSQEPDDADSILWDLGTEVAGLPAARQLSAEAVAGLLHMAVAADCRTDCFISIKQLNAWQDISTEQLTDLLTAAFGNKRTSGHSIFHLKCMPAFKQLEPAAVASIITDALTAAAAAVAGDNQGHTWRLYSLCIDILREDSVAGRDKEAVMQWLLPALTTALQLKMHYWASELLTEAVDKHGLLGTEEVVVLLQATLQLDRTGQVFDSTTRATKALNSLGAVQLVQLLRCSSMLTPGYHAKCARGALTRSKGWSSVSAHDKLVELLPVLLPWLSADDCKQRLEAAKLTALQTAVLAAAASKLWQQDKPGVPAKTWCGCLAKLQAGKAVQRCAMARYRACAAWQLRKVLLPVPTLPLADRAFAASAALAACIAKCIGIWLVLSALTVILGAVFA